MRKKELALLKKNVRLFFTELKKYDLKSLTDEQINNLFATHKLLIPDLHEHYSTKIYQKSSATK